MTSHRTLLTGICLLGFCSPLTADDFFWELGNANTNWNSAANWGGTLGQFPDDNTDSALITVPSAQVSPRLNASNITIGRLTIEANGDLNTGTSTNSFGLLVQASGSQDGSTSIRDAGSSLTVWQSPAVNDLDTDDLTIVDGSLILQQGSRVQVDRQLTLESSLFNNDGAIFGEGIVELNTNQDFANDGTIRADFGGDLTLQRTGTARIDLDGAFGGGALIADDESRLIIDIPTVAFSDAFNGTMSIGENAEIRINDNWNLGSVAQFNGGNGTATQSGNATTYSGTLNVNSGSAVLAAANTTIQNGASVNIADLTTLQFDSPTDIADPESVDVGGGATLIVNREVNVGSGAGAFDWDGTGVTNTTIVNANGRLNLDVATVDNAGYEIYDGTLTIKSGRVDVQNADGQWQLAGPLNLNAASTTARLSGVEVLVTGDVTVTGPGDARVSASTIFGATSDVDVAAGAELHLEGSTSEINGGSWTGSGTVSLNSDVTTVAEPTTVNMSGGRFNVDGYAPTINTVILDAPLTLNVMSIDISVESIAGTTEINSVGQLNVNLDDANQRYAFDGTLILNGLAGNLASLHLTGNDIEFDGTTRVTGNSITQARVDMSGDMNIAAGGTFNLASGAPDAPNTVDSSATFDGTGDLVVSSTGYLALEDTAIVSVELINRGHLEVGASIGAATVSSLILRPTSTYEVEIDGTSPGTEHDVLNVGAFATLDGLLEVLVNENGGSYADPDVQGTIDEFLLVIAGATNGAFDEFAYDGQLLEIAFSAIGQDRYHISEGLFRILNYDSNLTSLQNYKALGGDANGDGTVDGSDFLIWNTNKFTSGTDWTTGDFNGDGITDGGDFLIWNTNKFTSVGMVNAVPEAAPCLTMSGLFFAFMLVVRLRR